tara:strand:+ start:258 stop:596 length:339 start_codon:yes stop_codon:yes gene_type:complete
MTNRTLRNIRNRKSKKKKYSGSNKSKPSNLSNLSNIIKNADIIDSNSRDYMKKIKAYESLDNILHKKYKDPIYINDLIYDKLGNIYSTGKPLQVKYHKTIQHIKYMRLYHII